MTSHYSMTIQWSDEDQVYIVKLPEFGGCMTHGVTYEEAAKHGREAMESLIEIYQADGRRLPAPRCHDDKKPVRKKRIGRASTTKAKSTKRRKATA